MNLLPHPRSTSSSAYVAGRCGWLCKASIRRSGRLRPAAAGEWERLPDGSAGGGGRVGTVPDGSGRRRRASWERFWTAPDGPAERPSAGRYRSRAFRRSRVSPWLQRVARAGRSDGRIGPLGLASCDLGGSQRFLGRRGSGAQRPRMGADESLAGESRTASHGGPCDREASTAPPAPRSTRLRTPVAASAPSRSSFESSPCLERPVEGGNRLTR